jgi:hypothetical protein
MVKCETCQQLFETANGFSRWNLAFCSIKCMKIIQTKKEMATKDEDEKRKLDAKRQAGSFVAFGGVC